MNTNRAGQYAALAGLLGLLIGFVIVARLAPHAPNFTPAAAAALFASFVTRRAVLGYGVAALALLASDLIIGFYDWRVMASVYGAMAVPAALGSGFLASRPGPARIIACAAGGATLFFIVTNAAVWAFSDLYAKTADGLALSYLRALPFYKYMLAGDLVWSGALFGAWYFAGRLRSTAPWRSLTEA